MPVLSSVNLYLCIDMNMIRKSIVPTQNTYLLHLPDELLGKHVEVIAFSTDDVPANTDENDNNLRTVEQAIAFYQNNSVDFNKVAKWNREDLYE